MPKKKTKKKNLKKEDKEKVCEVFETKKKGKEKIVKTCGSMPTQHATKKELEKGNKTLRNVLIFIGIFALVFIITTQVIKQSYTIEYENVTFKKIDYSGLTLYHTKFPIVYNGKPTIYNEYLRLDPRKNSEKIPFEGELVGRDDIVLDIEEEFNCDGDGIISVANLKDLYEIIDINVVINETYKCDEQGRYMYVRLLEGNESKIVQTGTTCYDLHIKDCEILAVTERFMLETLVRINENF